MEVIRVKNLGIRFILPQDRPSTLKEAFLNVMRRGNRRRALWALKGVDFSINKGETIGIIGENGSGKSTLLRILAGIYQSDEGKSVVKGRISALIELGAGFHEELTGRENIYLNGSLLGMKKKRIEAIIDDIINFSELQELIDIPIKKYSSGMLLRLGFSIAAFVEPEIILIDEVLAVGDYYFQEKCFAKIFEFKQQGKTIVFVSHDMSAIRRICDRVLLLRKGEIIRDGEVEQNIKAYLRLAGPREGTAIIRSKDLELIFNNGRLFILWREKEITNNKGGYNDLHYGSAWAHSINAEWKVIESNQNSIIAEGKFEFLKIIIRWELKLLADNKFSWTIFLIPQVKVPKFENHTNLLVTPEYMKWFSSDKKGFFPPIDGEDIDWKLVYNGQDRRLKYIGLEGKHGTELPQIKLEFKEFEKGDFRRVLNTNFELNSRSLHSLLCRETPEKVELKKQPIKLFSALVSIS